MATTARQRALGRKYNRGYRLNFHLFLDMLEAAEVKKDVALKEQVLKGYFSEDWSVVKTEK